MSRIAGPKLGAQTQIAVIKLLERPMWREFHGRHDRIVEEALAIHVDDRPLYGTPGKNVTSIQE
jgi:hypothetical protein